MRDGRHGMAARQTRLQKWLFPAPARKPPDAPFNDPAAAVWAPAHWATEGARRLAEPDARLALVLDLRSSFWNLEGGDPGP